MAAKIRSMEDELLQLKEKHAARAAQKESLMLASANMDLSPRSLARRELCGRAIRAASDTRLIVEVEGASGANLELDEGLTGHSPLLKTAMTP